MRLRFSTISTLAALLFALPSIVAAQDAAPDAAPARTVRLTGSADFGLRLTDVSGDEARWQRFRDLSDGVYLNRFRLVEIGTDWRVRATADHVGREDQRYLLSYQSRGRLTVSLMWDQIPLWMSSSTRTLYTGIGTGTLLIADGIQASGQEDRTNLATFIDGARPFTLKYRRDVFRLDAAFSPTPEVDVSFNLKQTIRQGTQPYGAYNLQPIELPAPVDTRATDVGTSLQWTNTRARVSVGYQGSWFDNRAETLIWDNPWRLQDSATLGSSQGRMALWPDNALHAVTISGAVEVARRTNVTASATVGRASQDQTLLPFTINTEIESPMLPRPTAEAEVRNVAANVAVTSRPHPWVWVSARWRYYDSDNRIPKFDNADYIRADQRVSEFHEFISTAPLSFTRDNFDLDVSVTPQPFVAVRAAYSRNGSTWDNRIFAEAVEQVVRASIDTTTLGWLTLRGVVEHAVREGSGLREELLEAFEEQPAMRHFDIADRDRTRYTLLVQATPGSIVAASASLARGKDDYNDAHLGSGGFGLKSYENRRYSASVDVTPTEQVAAGVWYARESYEAFQRSRTARPGTQFTDPRRDWMLSTDDTVDTVSVDVDLLRLRDTVDVRIGYQTSRGTSDYVHTVADTSQVDAPVRLPQIENVLNTVTVDVLRALSDRVSVGVMYRYESYDVRDFLLDETFLTSLNMLGGMFLGYEFRPYTANGLWFRVNYRW